MHGNSCEDRNFWQFACIGLTKPQPIYRIGWSLSSEEMLRKMYLNVSRLRLSKFGGSSLKSNLLSCLIQSVMSPGSMPVTQGPITTTIKTPPATVRRENDVKPSPETGMCYFS
jgi:hypothetical protein